MFASGIGPRRSGSKALAAFKQADRLSHSDPRVTYAWGLIQYRRLQKDEAMKLLTRAARQPDQTYFPARRAKVWLQLSSSRQFENGLTDAETLAEELAKTTDRPKVREETAQWLCELLASILRTTTRKTHVEAAKTTEKKVRQIFADAGLERVWSVGQTAVERRYLARTQDNAANAEAAARRADANNKQEIEKLEKRLENLTDDAGKSELSKADLKGQFDELMQRIGNEFVSLEREYLALEQLAILKQREIDQVLKQITAVELLGNGGQPQPGTNRRQQRFLLDQQLATLQNQYVQLYNRASGVVARANSVAAFRTKAIADYQRRTGEIVKQQNDMSKWAARLKSRKGKIAKKKPVEKQKAKKPRKITLRALMPFDFNRERDRLLASFEPKKPAGDQK